MDISLIGDVLLDALLDSLRVLPFLFAAYLLIEYVERKKSESIEKGLRLGGRFGFVPGALLGCVPQCGFSAMAANFYACGVVTLGTLMAVFIATSDEAVPIMLAYPAHYPDMLLLVAIKLVYALLVGFLLDIALRRFVPAGLRGGYHDGAADVSCHSHEEEDSLLWAAVKHTASIFLTVFLFNLAFGFLVELVGAERISAFLAGLGVFQPMVAGLFGLIPNCAASITLTQLYVNGTLPFASVLAGLSTNAGVGLVVLFRANRNLRQSLFILALLYVLGTLPGQLIYLFGTVFT